MTERLSDEEIERGRELEAETTGSRWVLGWHTTQEAEVDALVHPDLMGNARFETVPISDGVYGVYDLPDAEFIVWARTNLLALLDEVQELRSRQNEEGNRNV